MANKARQIASGSFTSAATSVSDTFSIEPNTKQITLLGKFDRGASGGTAVKAYLQTTFDDGTTWQDVACIVFATTSAQKLISVAKDSKLAAVAGTDGTLADDTANAFFGQKWRLKMISTGTYVGPATLAAFIYESN